eukprot:TRINITY_DN54101_c0_g1_i1.p1 TRINITY_DN54101_c0_g1~~TRINITY_DN54101_c0_g1_i1.p1  ORF type:complete len:108 (-),score=17.87 TRINITY_DN54101_c0_g1_i1:57-380(-)
MCIRDSINTIVSGLPLIMLYSALSSMPLHRSLDRVGSYCPWCHCYSPHLGSSPSRGGMVPLYTPFVIGRIILVLSLIHISEPTRLLSISYAVFCLKKKTLNLTKRNR